VNGKSHQKADISIQHTDLQKQVKVNIFTVMNIITLLYDVMPCSLSNI